MSHTVVLVRHKHKPTLSHIKNVNELDELLSLQLLTNYTVLVIDDDTDIVNTLRPHGIKELKRTICRLCFSKTDTSDKFEPAFRDIEPSDMNSCE